MHETVLERTINVPENRQVMWPESLPTGEVRVLVFPVSRQTSEKSEERGEKTKEFTFQKIPDWRDPEVQAHCRANAHKRIGCMKGKISVPDDFDTMMQDEIIAMFEGTLK